ncbi:hypothetical protein O6P43_027029 [Quillaja saponaria]|uniref:Uncharacterized protein n=1 Tax=Quillaja saponaria TaxID=32244 RepID=A0AAD7L416_QUISA|nr:hypothetical protein O6P43_027029 [Quillaja saponaria]
MVEAMMEVYERVESKGSFDRSNYRCTHGQLIPSFQNVLIFFSIFTNKVSGLQQWCCSHTFTNFHCQK